MPRLQGGIACDRPLPLASRRLTLGRKESNFSYVSTAATIRASIAKIPRGEPFTVASLLVHGSRAAVDQSLSRLAKSGVVERITPGVYVRPEKSPFVEKVLPQPYRVAQVLAKERGEIVQVHGAEAARRLGLSTQVPARPVFLTSGRSRRFRVGKLEVVLKNVSRRKLEFAGEPAGLALTALWYLGKDQVSSEVLRTIDAHLPPGELEKLRRSPRVTPAWMADALRNYRRHHD